MREREGGREERAMERRGGGLRGREGRTEVQSREGRCTCTYTCIGICTGIFSH